MQPTLRSPVSTWRFEVVFGEGLPKVSAKQLRCIPVCLLPATSSPASHPHCWVEENGGVPSWLLGSFGSPYLSSSSGDRDVRKLKSP